MVFLMIVISGGFSFLLKNPIEKTMNYNACSQGGLQAWVEPQ